MKNLLSWIPTEYRRCLEQPVMMIAMMMMLCVAALYFARDFALDASSSTLISDDDPGLAYYSKLTETFSDSPFLVMTFSPVAGDLFSTHNLDRFKVLERAILDIDGVASVTSLLDAPLLLSPPVQVSDLATGYRSLRAGTADLPMAKAELRSSPLFSELLVSRDGNTALMQIMLTTNQPLHAIDSEIKKLLAQSTLTADEHTHLEGLRATQRQLSSVAKTSQANLISAIRSVREDFAADAQIYLGGVPMITSDMITYVKDDLSRFSVGIAALVSLALWIFFRRIRWVLIPLGTTAVSVLLMIGLLGFLNKPITPISASFISLMAIISISFSIHLIVRYRELRLQDPDQRHIDMVYETMSSKLAPCVYTALTTGIAFASLLTSGILPLIDFGWIMVIGVFVSLTVTYVFFASVLVLMPKGEASATLNDQVETTQWFSNLTLRYPWQLLIASVLLLLASGYGITRISLENRFVDYFKSGSEIREGMTFIDQHLGGTLPMEIVIQFPPYEAVVLDDEDNFGDPFASTQEQIDPRLYWIDPGKIELLRKFGEFLDSRPEIGKSVSLANVEAVARPFNDGKALGSLELVAVLSLLPADVRRRIIDPYVSPDTGKLRITTRVHETGPPFLKSELIADIERFAVQQAGVSPENIHVTGLAVLFNNMLNLLALSQTSTIGFVILATLATFIILMRSLTLGLIGVAANLITPVAMLGFMGFAQMPLNLMTITIAAIVVGIGVDDAIHYLHRFKEEMEQGRSVSEAVARSHRGIGSAIYYTSLTVIFGFSVLGLSNFVPMIQFGILTAFAMGMALVVNLTVLPALLLVVIRR